MSGCVDNSGSLAMLRFQYAEGPVTVGADNTPVFPVGSVDGRING